MEGLRAEDRLLAMLDALETAPDTTDDADDAREETDPPVEDAPDEVAEGGAVEDAPEAELIPTIWAEISAGQ